MSREIPQAPAVPAADAPPGRRARVLVVDDELAIGAALKRILTMYHDVSSVTSAQDALDLIRAGQHYDVIVTDLMMPTMTGMDLHDELAREKPEMAERMVFATGGAFTIRAREFLDSVPNPRLEKPFELKNLLALINSLIR